MRVAVCDYQGKSAYLVSRLQAAGVEIPVDVQSADVLLADAPGLRGVENVPEVLEAQRRGIPVVGYPHGGNIMLWPHYVDHTQTSVELVQSPGQARIFEERGIHYRIVGWMYSERRPFIMAPEYQQRVLFCPQHHPQPDEQAANEHARAQLAGLDYSTHDGDTVPEALRAIEQADVVIGNDTVLALALALGKPAIAIQSDRFTVDGHACPFDESYVYPLALDRMPLAEALEICRDESVVAGWRDLWVGGPLDVEAATACLSEYA